MNQSTLTRIVSDAEHATTLPELKRTLENVALVLSLINAKPKPQPRASTKAAILAFEDSKKNRVRR